MCSSRAVVVQNAQVARSRGQKPAATTRGGESAPAPCPPDRRSRPRSRRWDRAALDANLEATHREAALAGRDHVLEHPFRTIDPGQSDSLDVAAIEPERDRMQPIHPHRHELTGPYLRDGARMRVCVPGLELEPAGQREVGAEPDRAESVLVGVDQDENRAVVEPSARGGVADAAGSTRKLGERLRSALPSAERIKATGDGASARSCVRPRTSTRPSIDEQAAGKRFVLSMSDVR